MALALAACAPPDSSGLNGLWEGRFDINGRGDFDFTALHVNGRVFAVSRDARVLCQGEAAIADGRYRAEMKMHFVNANPFDTAILEGAVDAASADIDARFMTQGAGDKGRMRLRYLKALHERGADLAAVAGEWILYEGAAITKLSIDADGVMRGGDTHACGLAGRIAAVDPARNAYSVRLTGESCEKIDGRLDGMAYLGDSVAPGDTLNLFLFTADWSLFMPLARDARAPVERKKPV